MVNAMPCKFFFVHIACGPRPQRPSQEGFTDDAKELANPNTKMFSEAVGTTYIRCPPSRV